MHWFRNGILLGKCKYLHELSADIRLLVTCIFKIALLERIAIDIYNVNISIMFQRINSKCYYQMIENDL